jgi:hypothetical protein
MPRRDTVGAMHPDEATQRGPSHALVLFLVALAAAAAYAPALAIPLFQDDYPNLKQALIYGPWDGWPALFRDGTFRLRATSYWTMFLLWRAFHLSAWAYHLASLLLHIACAWLVYATALAWGRIRVAAGWAALFFAVQEGHQEAVMWFSAVNELLLFFFGMAALLCWMKACAARRSWPWQAAGMALFVLAALSKESVVVFLPLFVLTARWADWRRWLPRLLPYAAIAALAAASVLASRAYSFRFSDGSFSLHAPFWTTWPRNFARLMWVWGWVAAALVYLSRDRHLTRQAAVFLVWIGIGLAPYSFLTYSTEIPSRQTYLASAGLAFLVGIAAAHAWQRWGHRPRLVSAVLALVLLVNIGYLWTRKRRQFLERAAPTEQLIALARRTPGPIWVQCYPDPSIIAEEAVHLAAGREPTGLVWSARDAADLKGVAVFCWPPKEKGSK